jgi:hypothetical protein
MKLARNVTSPLEKHYGAALQIVRYLMSTKELKIEFGNVNAGNNIDTLKELTTNNKLSQPQKLSELQLVGYTDADWGADKNDRKSLSGGVVYLHGGPISWWVSKQKSVSLSSMESEIYALSLCGKSIKGTQILLESIGIIIDQPTTIYCDNNATIEIATNHVYRERARHIDIRDNFIRDLVKKNIVKVTRIDTKENMADMFTKNLPKDRFNYLSKRLLRTNGGALKSEAECLGSWSFSMHVNTDEHDGNKWRVHDDKNESEDNKYTSTC